MKTRLTILALAILLLVTTSPCFGRWAALSVSKEEAKAMGLQVRTTAAGSTQVRVELEFKTEGNFQEFGPEGKFKDQRRVELWVGDVNTPRMTAALKEDHSTASRVVVGFTADRGQLDESHLRVIVPHAGDGAKGVTYVLRVKDFVDLKEGR